MKENYPKNIILYGPPGTGKTYNTMRWSVKIIENLSDDEVNSLSDKEIKEKYDLYSNNNQIKFVTFHQSYGYEEFIEGIKPKVEDNNVIYDTEDGIFKKFCNDIDKQNTISKVGNNDNFKECWDKLVKEIKDNPNYKFEGLTKQSIDINSKGSIRFNPNGRVVKPNEIYKLYKEGKSKLRNIDNHKKVLEDLRTKYGLNYPYKENTNSNKNYVFIIDEINRGNISKIFGELITLLEENKRNGSEEEKSVILPYSNEAFSIPSNVYILGTMNTADKSLVQLDSALRRRFSFYEMMPDPSLLKDINIGKINVSTLLKTLNQRIELLLDRDHLIGHSYFLKLKNTPDLETLSNIMINNILPLLQEYFYDDYSKIMLILGDNQKDDDETRFIIKEKYDKSLFGSLDEYNIEEESLVSYKINLDAFKNEFAYKYLGYVKEENKDNNN